MTLCIMTLCDFLPFLTKRHFRRSDKWVVDTSIFSQQAEKISVPRDFRHVSVSRRRAADHPPVAGRCSSGVSCRSTPAWGAPCRTGRPRTHAASPPAGSPAPRPDTAHHGIIQHTTQHLIDQHTTHTASLMLNIF